MENSKGKIGMLWWTDSKQNWFERIDSGYNYFKDKYQKQPTELHINNADFESLNLFAKSALFFKGVDDIEEQGTPSSPSEVTLYKEMRVIPDSHIMKNHLLYY